MSRGDGAGPSPKPRRTQTLRNPTERTNRLQNSVTPLPDRPDTKVAVETPRTAPILPVPSSATQPAEPTEPAQPEPPVRPRTVEHPPSTQPEKAFAQLIEFEGLAEGAWPEKVALVEAFLKAHPNFLARQKALTLLDQLKANSNAANVNEKKLEAKNGQTETEAASLEKDRARFQDVLNEMQPLLRINQFKKAQDLLAQRAREPELAGAQAQAWIKEEQSNIEGVLALRQSAILALQKMKGQKFSIEIGKMKLAGKILPSPAKDRVNFRTDQGAEISIGAHQLSVEQVEALVPLRASNASNASDASKDEGRSRGMLHLYAGNLPEAQKHFERMAKVGESSSEALAYCWMRFKALAMDQKEDQARKHWERAEKQYAIKDWAGANKAWTAFLEKFMDTAFGESKKTALAENLKALELRLNPLQPGLIGYYYSKTSYEDRDLVLIERRRKIDFTWPGAPQPEVPADYFSVKWVGLIKIETPGMYEFSANVDDFLKIWIDGKKIADWVFGPIHASQPVALRIGFHPIEIRFEDKASTAKAILSWKRQGDPAKPEIIPSKAFWHDPSAEPQPGLPSLKPLPPEKGSYFDDLQVLDKKLSFGQLGKEGLLGYGSKRIMVSKVWSRHGLSTHAPAWVRYKLDRPYRFFAAHAAVNDTSKEEGFVFKVFGDGKLLWTSESLGNNKRFQKCLVALKGVRILKLQCEKAGATSSAHSVWFEPRLLMEKPLR